MRYILNIKLNYNIKLIFKNKIKIITKTIVYLNLEIIIICSNTQKFLLTIIYHLYYK